MKVCVIGTGYVGLVTGVCLAEIGHDIICVDKDESKISSLKEGKIPIYEEGLKELVKSNYKSKKLIFDSDTSNGVRKSDIIFICVGTPPLPSGKPDLAA
ncbi:MAG: UDP-glucose 6-dehydrogenase, partial [Bacteroidales bacterium]|nr:UDP-glucose 6-dehydrogenase [Bacteroidales bacterium]